MSTEDSSEVWRTWEGDLRRYVEQRTDSSAVDDVLQEISLRVHQNLPNLRDDERIAPWVFRIARSVVVDLHRRQRPTAPLPEDLTDADDDERASTAPLAIWLGSALGTLPPHYREALTLTDAQGMSQKDAAEQLGVTYSAMKSRVQRGRALLRDLVRKCCEVEVAATGGVIDFKSRGGSCC